MTITIGIDPGKTGGIAAMSDNFVDVFPIPLAGDEIDMPLIYDKLQEISIGRTDVRAYIEKVHAMPQQGVRSMFTFGFTVGALHGIIACLKIPLFQISPQSWKKLVLVDTKKDKDAAITYCRNVYPDVSLFATERSRTYHDGMAEALCIATYGRMVNHENIRRR